MGLGFGLGVVMGGQGYGVGVGGWELGPVGHRGVFLGLGWGLGFG